MAILPCALSVRRAGINLLTCLIVDLDPVTIPAGKGITRNARAVLC